MIVINEEGLQAERQCDVAARPSHLATESFNVHPISRGRLLRPQPSANVNSQALRQP